MRRRLSARALAEDRAVEDVTTLATVAAATRAVPPASLAKEDGVLAGMPVALRARSASSTLRCALTPLVADGAGVRTWDDVLAEVTGPVRGDPPG